MHKKNKIKRMKLFSLWKINKHFQERLAHLFIFDRLNKLKSVYIFVWVILLLLAIQSLRETGECINKYISNYI